MITSLLNKLPIVKRFNQAITAYHHENTRLHAARAADLTSLDALRLQLNNAETELREAEEELDGVRKKRNELFRTVDELKATVINQAATLDGFKLVRNHNEHLIADMRGRETRWMNTVDALQSVLRTREAQADDLRAELTDAQTQLATHNKPVLFARAPGLADEDIDATLAGCAGLPIVKGILQLLDECAVQAMSEAATPPAAATDTSRGFALEDRTYSAGGVFALTTFKGQLETKLAARAEKAAA